MAKYTIELRKVCDYYTREEVEKWFKSYNLEDFLTPQQIQVIENNGLWSKDKLARKIVNHYFMREIGFETPALFAHYAKVTMEELMEEKLPLIYSRCIDFDPLVNVDFTETFERTVEGSASSNALTNGTGNSNSNSSSNSSSLGIENSTPQKRITKQDLNTGAYASAVSQNDNNSSIEDITTTNTNSTSQASSENDQLEKYTRTQKGNSGVSATAQKLIEQYRNIIIAIDKEIIEELNSLFMGLY
jgi:hypothetical protein